MPAYTIHVLEHRHCNKEIVDSGTNYNVLVGNEGFVRIQSMNELERVLAFLYDRTIRRRGERREDEKSRGMIGGAEDAR